MAYIPTTGEASKVLAPFCFIVPFVMVAEMLLITELGMNHTKSITITEH
jgi:hypothetical protein